MLTTIKRSSEYFRYIINSHSRNFISTDDRIQDILNRIHRTHSHETPVIYPLSAIEKDAMCAGVEPSQNEHLGFSSVSEALEMNKGGLPPYEMVLAHHIRSNYLDDSYRFFIDQPSDIITKAVVMSENRNREKGEAQGLTYHIKDTPRHNFPSHRVNEGSMAKVYYNRDDSPTTFTSLVKKLHFEQASFLGSTSVPEFSLAAHCQSIFNGTTRNPHNWNLSPGGSSGGAAGAIAAGIGHVALTTDGAGSTRIPASLCGVVGFKPRITFPPTLVKGLDTPIRFGTHANTSSLITRGVQDCAIALDILTDSQFNFKQQLTTKWNRKFRVGLLLHTLNSKEIQHPLVTDAVACAFNSIQEYFGKYLNTEFDFIHLNDFGFTDPISEAEHWFRSQIYARYSSDESIKEAQNEYPEFIHSSVQKIIETYKKSLDEQDLRDKEHSVRRKEVVTGVAKLFEDLDFLITPTITSLAWPAMNTRPTSSEKDVDFSWNPYTYIFNWSDNAAISIPCGVTPPIDGFTLPVGIQIVAKKLKNADDHINLLKFAYTLQEFVLHIDPINRPIFLGLRYYDIPNRRCTTRNIVK